MAMLNECNFIGRVGKQPVAQKSGEGKLYLKFTLYVDQGKDQKGTEKEAMPLPFVCFGKLAELMAEKLMQGQQVYVKSRVQRSTYTGGDEIVRESFSFQAVDIQLLDRREKKATEEGREAKEAP